MTFMGYTAAAAIFAALWAAFATGRKSWLVTVFWAGVVLVMSLGAKRGLVMNGLCLLIAVFETILSIRAMYGVIMWNQSFKDKGVVLPAGGHAVYINMDEFFDGKRGHDTFAGEGFSLELIRRYGIRVSELGDYSMEYDLKTPEQQAELANVVRFAIDRSRLTQEHLDYVIAAVKALYEDRESIPNMRIVWGHKLPMRHFHAFLEPYPNEEK